MATDKPLAFFRQTLRDFRNTGALAPSGLFLARAIAKTLPETIDDDYRVMEVGPGTGSITSELCRRMNGRGHLDLFEISPEFCSLLNERVSDEPIFAPMKSRLRIHQGDVREIKGRKDYNAVISGLPFNNFSPDEVESFLLHFRDVLQPGGTLVWFEYVAIRKLQSPFVSRRRREQLRGIHDITSRFVKEHQFRQQIIPINLPPARIRQLKFG